MSESKGVKAGLAIRMTVDCPNEECGSSIDLLNAEETDFCDHNDDGHLINQMFPDNGSHDDFECEDVTCSECKTTFNVKGLEW